MAKYNNRTRPSALQSVVDAARTEWRRTRGPASRRDRALERNAAAASLTPQQRIELLDKRLGVGVGADRERARLTRKIANSNVVTTVAVVEEPKAKSAKEPTAPRRRLTAKEARAASKQ
ncbi:MAG: hypothetical protein PVI21_03670 [Candidatus Woesebacteria bacterium]